MKKFLKAGKKTLSVIMAIMMVLTAWVWVAPTEASAAAGNYKVKVWLDINDSAYSGDQTIYIDYYTNNGTGTTGTDSTATFGSFNDGDVTKEVDNIPGFPYQVRVYSSGLNLWGSSVKYGINVYVTNAGGSSYSTLYTEDTSTHSHSGTSAFTDTVTIPKSVFPYVNTFPDVTVNRDIYLPTIITSGRYSSNTVTVGQAKDQYGVNYMDAETITVSGSVCGTTGLTTSKSGSVLTVTGANTAKNENGTSQTATVVAKWKSANTSYNTTSTYRSKTYSSAFTIYNPEQKFTYDGNGGTVNTSNAVKYYAGTIGNSFPATGTRTGYTFLGMFADKHDISYEENVATSEQLTSGKVVKENKTWYTAWQANQYSMTFKYRDTDGNWITTNPVTEYYGRSIPFPTITSPVTDGVDYTYTFTGWSPAHTTVQAVDGQTYTAEYSMVTHYADLTALEEAIADAKAKQATALYNENAYTETSVSVFEDTLALAEATVNRAPLFSEQTSVDGLADTLNNANNNLDIKNYTVLFVDEDGTILKDGYFFVPHGASVTVPQNPEKAYDETNHYAFDFWDYEESDGLDECNYVTDNLIYVASFLATPHTFTETKTPSTCTADGVITYTCDCGYSYTAADPDDLASHKWSTDYKELVPATCATAGSEAKYCTACDAVDESSKREIEKLGHNFGEYTEYTPATCFGKGAEIATCSRCEAKDVKEIPQKSHIYGAAETVEKTCTADGYTKEVCTLCGFTNIRDIDAAKGHTLKVESVPETCVSVGYAKTYCEKCDFERTTTYPATGVHSYPDTWETVAEASCVGNGVEKRVCTVCNSATETRLTALAEHISPAEWTVEVPATCDGDGRQVKNCTVCGKELEAETIAKLGHNYEAYAEGTYDATCTTAGATAVKCSLCSDINITVLQPTGHKFENEGAIVETAATCTSSAYKTYNCDNCDYSYVEHIIGSTVLPHDFTGTETVISAATCTADGKKTVQCKNCDATTEVILPKLGHAYGDWQVVKEATNSEDGQWKRVCANNAEHVEYITIPKGGHAWDSGTVTEAASCEATGTMVYKCTAHTDCGVTLEVTIPVTQHTVAQKVTAATCTTPGTVKAYCSVCDAECANPFSTTETPVKAHNYVAGEAVAPSCTTSGYTPYTCSCGKTYNVYDVSKPATGHSLVEGASTANCTEAGKMTLTCSVCNNYTTTVDVPALGHNYVEDASAATEATCAASATKTYKCSRCADSYTISVGDKTSEHTWGKETVVEAATATSLGYKTVECSVCGQIKAETIPATGDHEFTVETTDKKDATCTQDGYIVYACATNHSCGLTSKVTVPATGHKEGLDYKAATCGEAGYARMVCTVDGCNEVLSEEVIPALGHLYGEGTVTNATCNETGKIEYICTRTGCGATHEAVIATNTNAHRYETVVTPATCYKEGSVVTKCALCDDEITNEDLPMIEHTWNDGEIKQGDAATCTADGKKTYTCTVENCGATKTETISKLGHDWSAWTVTKASTNTEKGEMTRTCSRGCTEKVEIPAGGHNLVVSSSTAATCTAGGSITYTCDTVHEGGVACGITITVTLDKLQHELETTKKDATCTTPGEVVTKCTKCDTLTITTEIPATGHSYTGSVTKAATCTEEGVKTYTCSKCSDSYTEALPKLQHVYTKSDETAPTCTASGYTTYTCEKCGYSYNEIGADAKGHTLEKTVINGSCTKDGSVVLSCEECDYEVTVDVPALGHDYTKISSTDATCAAAATETYRCSRCDAEYTVSVGDKLTGENAHTWGAWSVVIEATHTTLGCESRVCSVCGKLEVRTVEATGDHSFTNGEIADSKQATCTKNGYITRKCAVHDDCGLTSTEIIAATGHTETAIPAVEATCTAPGSSAGSKCTVCDEVIVAPVTLPALDHAWGNENVTPASCKEAGKIEYTCTRTGCTATHTVEIPVDGDAHNYITTVHQATCTDDGSVVTECSLCGVTTTETIPAKGHTFTGAETIVDKATCTLDGLKTIKCASCDATTEVIIPKLGHKMVAGVAVEATCTSSGYTPYTCENGCGESYKVYDATVKEHSYVQVEDSSTATCTDGGTVTLKCTCGDTIEAVVPALGHSYGEWTVINPTAETEGSKTRECGRCHVTETVILPKLGHEMVKDVNASAAPTCTTEGTDVYVCTTHTGDAACGYTYSVTVAAKGHSYGEGVVTESATCTENGVKTFTCTADGCEAKTTEVIPRTGHTLSTTVNEATCKAAGSVVTKCASCDYSVEKSLEQKPHTISVSYAYPSCSSEGYVKEACDKCDYEKIISTIPALGHSYTGDETVINGATCLEKGEKTVKCSRCDATTTVEIPATGHNYVATETVPATCTESGYILRACDNKDCEASYKELTSNPNGHTWKTTAESETKATCEADGVAVYKCQFCEATNEVITPKFGHSWGEWSITKAPTATDEGEQTRTCIRGGCKETVAIPALGESATYTVKFVVNGEVIYTQTVNYLGSATAPAVADKAPDSKYHYSFGWDRDFSKVTGDLTVNGVYTPVSHTYGEWVVDKTADCRNEGLRHRECDCGYVQQETVAKLAHDFSEILEEKAATCTDNGYKVVACKNCGDTETQTVKKLGHSMTYYQGYAATCDTDGVASHYSCSRCGNDFEDRAGNKQLTTTVITKKYHTYIVVEGSAATCTNDGVTDYRYCTSCGYTQHPQTIPATGHADVNNDNSCDKCGATYMQGGEIVCSCSCHKTGFFNELIYKILSFFWRLFGSNKSCECGRVHY